MRWVEATSDDLMEATVAELQRRKGSSLLAERRAHRLAELLASQKSLLWIVAACQSISLMISWPLWQIHTSPPMLPAAPLPNVNFGMPLQASLVAAVVRPSVGVPLHTLLLAYAMLVDQTRLQPEFISLALLLWGCLPSHRAMMLARAHLISLWIFSGLNKLLSPWFMNGTAQWMLSAYVTGAPFWLRDNFGFVVVVAEASLGILSLFPQTRRFVGILALVVHFNILLVLSPFGKNWNHVVWPWNVALAISGFVLISSWRKGIVESLQQCGHVVFIGLVFLMLMPMGFYLLVVDAYVAHNLYTSNTAHEIVCNAQNRCNAGGLTQTSWRAFNVPLPPEHRLFESYFAQTCQPGDHLTVLDSRMLARWLGRDRLTTACPL